MQARHGEACGCHPIAQQIAMLKQEFAIALGGDRLAVIDARELPVAAQAARHRDGHACSSGVVAALDRDQYQARGWAIAQLVHQQLLRGGGTCGQKRRQVRDVVGARHDDGRQCEATEPERRYARAPPVHDAAGARRVISERSPSAWRISIFSSWSRDPSICTRATLFANWGSRGTRTRFQRSTLPENST